MQDRECCVLPRSLDGRYCGGHDFVQLSLRQWTSEEPALYWNGTDSSTTPPVLNIIKDIDG